MNVIKFKVFGTPKAQPRVKAMRAGAFVRMYTPGSANDWKQAIAAAALLHRPETPITGPVSVNSTFYFTRPKRLMRKIDPDGEIPHTTKPDRDNLDKAVLDALTGLGFWRDDCQVWDGSPRKLYAPKDGVGHAVIEIIW